MKKNTIVFLFISLILAGSLTLLSGCDNSEFPKSCGVFINSRLDTKLQSAFVGGGRANPKEGYSHRFHMYEGNYSKGPNWEEVKENVLITGFRYAEKTYASMGDCINRIEIHGLPDIGDIDILLNQGKYEGGNEQVSSVKVKDYSFGAFDSNGNQVEDSKINIHIVLKGGKTIDIRYIGETPYDGYF